MAIIGAITKKMICLHSFCLQIFLLLWSVCIRSLLVHRRMHGRAGTDWDSWVMPGHQNLLAAAIVFTIPSVLFPLASNLSRFTSHVSRLTSHISHFTFNLSPFIILFLLNLYLLILSVSRGGLLTLIIMVVVFIFLNFNTKAGLVFIFLVISASGILFFSSQTVRDFVFKTENRIGDRRIINIQETIQAAKNGGLFGFGYGISQPPGSTNVIGHYENNGQLFVREKMIGALAIVEETGIVGLGLFLASLGYVFWFLIRLIFESKIKDPINRSAMLEDKMAAAFLIAVLVGLCFHAQVEAWWVGVGSIELPIFYFLLKPVKAE
ncbi:MAG: O-antigen ligase family protein [Sphingobacteriaceae bacterium]|nr:O-antigen ligase family protein [Sphingobacteriaceae bacterium]